MIANTLLLSSADMAGQPRSKIIKDNPVENDLDSFGAPFTLQCLPVGAPVVSHASGPIKDNLSFQYRFLIALKVGLNTSAEPYVCKGARSMIGL